MFIDGTVIDVGDLPNGRGVEIKLSAAQTIQIVGLSVPQCREIVRMMFHRVAVKIESKDDAERFRDEDLPAKLPSNIDEATGIKKSGEI